MDSTTKAQEEAEPIKSELDAVQKQLENHKVQYYSNIAVIKYRIAGKFDREFNLTV